MGMRNEIFGFSQEKVMLCKAGYKEKSKKGRIITKEVRLDTTDLLILRLIADMCLKGKNISKRVNGEKYYWISYDGILDMLPILNIKKQALSDRIKKLCVLGLVREVVYADKNYGNMTVFQLGDNYEEILYKKEEKEHYEEKHDDHTDMFIRVFLKSSDTLPIGETYASVCELMLSDKDVDWKRVKIHIRQMPYDDFLHSLYWLAISGLIKESYCYTCDLCGERGARMEVHHKNYKNHGDELHHLDDLVCLCHDCHSRYHGKK